jgi:hypothetical protein
MLMIKKLTITNYPLMGKQQFFFIQDKLSQNSQQGTRFVFQWKNKDKDFDLHEFFSDLDSLYSFCQEKGRPGQLGSSLKKIFLSLLSPLEIKKFQSLLPALSFHWESWRLKDLLNQILFLKYWLSHWTQKSFLNPFSSDKVTPRSSSLVLGYQAPCFELPSNVVKLQFTSFSPYWLLLTEQTAFSFLIDWKFQIEHRAAPAKLRSARKVLQSLPIDHEKGQFVYLDQPVFDVSFRKDWQTETRQSSLP